jgi:hypothetical protein
MTIRTGRRMVRKVSTAVVSKAESARADVMAIRGGTGLVRAQTSLINTAHGLAKSYGERLHGCNPRNMNAENAQELSPKLQAAFEPLSRSPSRVTRR